MTAPHLTPVVAPLSGSGTGRGTDPPRPVRLDRSLAPRAKRRREAQIVANPSASGPLSAVDSAAALQRAQLPAFAPLLEEFELAGWSSHRRIVSGNFHDWLLVDGRELLVAVGQAVGRTSTNSTEAALVAQAAWAAIRAHAYHVRDAGSLLSFAARSLWSVPTAELRASVAVAIINTVEGHASIAMAGDCLAWKVRAAAAEQLARRQPMLGELADFTYLAQRVDLALRERLLLVADDPLGRSPKLAGRIASSFAQLDAESHRRMLAADAINLVRRQYEQAPCDEEPASPVSIVAVRRR